MLIVIDQHTDGMILSVYTDAPAEVRVAYKPKDAAGRRISAPLQMRSFAAMPDALKEAWTRETGSNSFPPWPERRETGSND